MRRIVKKWSKATLWMLMAFVAVGAVFAGGGQEEAATPEVRDTLRIAIGAEPESSTRST
jgi:hypothetical protein